MTRNQENLVITVVLAAMLIITMASFVVYVSGLPKQPIESTRRVVLTCTVKSNIDGVITINDECKITVIGEE